MRSRYGTFLAQRRRGRREALYVPVVPAVPVVLVTFLVSLSLERQLGHGRLCPPLSMTATNPTRPQPTTTDPIISDRVSPNPRPSQKFSIFPLRIAMGLWYNINVFLCACWTRYARSGMRSTLSQGGARPKSFGSSVRAPARGNTAMMS